MWSRHSRRTVLTNRSAKALARGARIGVRMTRTPSVRNTSSNGTENLASRSRSRNLTSPSRSSIARFLACWVTHAESGCAVTPTTCSRRVRELDEEQDEDRLQPDCLHGEEVGRKDPRHL